MSNELAVGDTNILTADTTNLFNKKCRVPIETQFLCVNVILNTQF